MKRIPAILIVALTLVIFPENLEAQCGMCKAVIESSAQEGYELVEGVNNGILYMMGVPYLLMFVIGFAWYKKFWNNHPE